MVFGKNGLIEKVAAADDQGLSQSAPQKPGRFHYLAIAALLVAILVQGISDIRGMSITWDEPMYIGIGNFILRTGKLDFLHLEGLHFHPIWTFYLNSIFLLFLKLPLETMVIPDHAVYTNSAGHALLFHSGYRPETILFLCRLPILLQLFVLAATVYRFASRLFGPTAGLVALAALAFDPNVLAHSAIACTDSSLTVWIFSTIYFYWEYLQTGKNKWLLATSLAAGLAILSKINAPFLLALFLPSMFVAKMYSSGKLTWQGIKTDGVKRVGQLGLILGMVCFMIWGAYGFGQGLTYKQSAPFSLSGKAAIKQYMQSTDFLRLPLAPYAVVVANVTNRAVGIGRNAYMLGRCSATGFRSYVFVDFLIKTSLPILILMTLTMIFWRRLPRMDLTAATILGLGIAVPIVLAIPEHSNCGIRYILPVYPFIYVAISRLATGRSKKPVALNLGLVQICLVALLSWNAIGSMISCPNQIAYFNSLFNNPAKKYHYLVDSNLDWGNELYDLRSFMKANHIEEVALSYFGIVNPSDYGINYKEADNSSVGWIAISATNLVGAFGTKDLSEFRSMKPVAVLCDGGMLIYHR